MPPPMAGSLLHELAELAQQIIYDSVGWPEPARGVAATGGWLEQIERPGGRWRVASRPELAAAEILAAAAGASRWGR